MNYFKVSLGIFFTLAISRFLPHPPNFTALIALSFYIPALMGRKYIFAIIFSYFITDLYIGIHSTTLFTWGSVLIIGLLSEKFKKTLILRLSGALTGAVIFFIFTNFGVWVLGSYGYTFAGLLNSYTLAIPFFTYSLLSTLAFSIIIEIFYLMNKLIKGKLSSI